MVPINSSFFKYFRDLINENTSPSSIAFLLSQIAMLSINLSFIVFILLLIGGIEQNPGPTFQFSKVVLATTNQGDINKYGKTAGTQCAAMDLLSACWSLYKKCSLWTKLDLDCILDHGDTLFKSLGLGRSLYVDELLTIVKIEDCTFHVNRVAIETAEIRINNFNFFLFRVMPLRFCGLQQPS